MSSDLWHEAGFQERWVGDRLDEEFPRDHSYIIQDSLIWLKLDAFIVAGSSVSVKLEWSRMEPMKTDMELLSNSMATYAHIKGNYGNHSVSTPWWLFYDISVFNGNCKLKSVSWTWVLHWICSSQHEDIIPADSCSLDPPEKSCLCSLMSTCLLKASLSRCCCCCCCFNKIMAVQFSPTVNRNFLSHLIFLNSSAVSRCLETPHVNLVLVRSGAGSIWTLVSQRVHKTKAKTVVPVGPWLFAVIATRSRCFILLMLLLWSHSQPRELRPFLHDGRLLWSAHGALPHGDRHHLQDSAPQQTPPLPWEETAEGALCQREGSEHHRGWRGRARP